MFKPLSTCILSCILFTHLPSYAAEPGKALVKVNDTIITQQDYDNYAKARAKHTHSKTTPDKTTLIRELIQREVIRQDAVRKGLDKNPDFLRDIKYIEDNLLMAISMHDYLAKHPIDELALKRHYNSELARLEIPNEYKVRHILVKTKKQAQTVIAALTQGQSFSQLALENSIDKGSAKKAGELGWVTQSAVPKKFATALAKLEKGKYTTTPIRSQSGWHIIQLDEMRQVPPSSFENVKSELLFKLQNKQMNTYVANLIKKAKIKPLQ
jgi:peptidyl-prolyl cis-trans isomerase C